MKMKISQVEFKKLVQQIDDLKKIHTQYYMQVLIEDVEIERQL